MALRGSKESLHFEGDGRNPLEMVIWRESGEQQAGSRRLPPCEAAREEGVRKGKIIADGSITWRY